MVNYTITWEYNGMDSTYQLVEVNGRYNLENVVDGHLLVDYGWDTVEALENGLTVIEKISKWVKEEVKTESESLQEWDNNNGSITIEKPSNVEKVETVEGLTEKEIKLLKAMYECTFELGLPVDKDDVAEESGLSKRSISGVVSSLYKKGLVESYDKDKMPGFRDEYMLNDKGFELVESWNKGE